MKKVLTLVFVTCCLAALTSCGKKSLKDEDIKGPYIEVNGEKINLRNGIDPNKLGADSTVVMEHIKKSIEQVNTNLYE